MRYLIIEDERLAMTELRRMITRLRPGYESAGWCESVGAAVSRLQGQTDVDIVFADIRLTDGMSFDIFDTIGYDGPVIFTTAYDEYALRAFKVNGIDYLLKPIDPDELETAILKFERLKNGGHEKSAPAQKSVKNRFLVSVGNDMISLSAGEVAFFNSEDGYTYATTFAGKRYIVDMSIESLDSMLDATAFCRVSRAYICHLEAVVRVARMFGGRLKVITRPESPTPVLVSRERAPRVMRWLDGERV